VVNTQMLSTPPLCMMSSMELQPVVNTQMLSTPPLWIMSSMELQPLVNTQMLSTPPLCMISSTELQPAELKPLQFSTTYGPAACFRIPSQFEARYGKQ